MANRVNVNNIKSIREKLDLSQSQFADKFNIPVSTLQCWEQNINNPTKYTSYMIEKILELEDEVNELKSQLNTSQ